MFRPSTLLASLELMFWNGENKELRPLAPYLGEQLRERLRLALDFATLGAYELTGAEDDPEPASSSTACGPIQREGPKRVFLFVKVPAGCAASEPLEPRCPAIPGTSRAAKERPLRRRGGVQAPEQPCICSARASARF
jgi:hypothetical protein